jgi:DsbC/DsbD-like thiol-disulfide interchange protein
MAILDLMELYRATGDVSYRDHAGKALEALSSVISRAPAAVPLVLVGLEQYLRSGAGLNAKQPLGPDRLDDLPEQIVSAAARLADGNPASLATGREFDAIITVKIENGWHIYANPAGLAEMKPTTLGLDSRAQQVISLVKVSYPAGDAKVLGSVGTEKVALYEGKVEFTARLKVSEQAKSGAVRVPLKLSYQACNDRVCQAPAQLEISLTVTIAQ